MAIHRLKHMMQSNRSSGCGPACLAIVSGRSEDEAIKAIFGDGRSKELRTYWPDLNRGLMGLGVSVNGRARRAGSWKSIKSTAIVACGRIKGATRSKDKWHWVVFQPNESGGPGLIYDPLRSDPYEPDGRTRKPFSYLPVTPIHD